MYEPREELASSIEDMVGRKSPVGEIQARERVVPKATTLLAAAALLLTRETNKVYEQDPDLGRALEEEGIKGCRLAMLFGAHVITDGLYKQLKGADVVTGELNHVITEGADEADFRVDLRTDAEVFWDHLKQLKPRSGAEGVSKETVEGKRNMARLWQEGKAFLVSDHTHLSKNPYGSITTQASAKYWRTRVGILNLMALSAIAYDAKKVGITRREFLKLSLAGVGYLALSQLYRSLRLTAIDQQYLEAAPSKEVSLVYSKIEGAAENLGGAYLALTEDPLIAREFRRLKEIRNRGMALNSLYLAHLISRHEELRQSLAGGKKEVEVAFFAGGGHITAKSEFCKGSGKLQEELCSTAKSAIDQYLVDVATGADEPEKLTTYYADHLSAFSSPNLSRKNGVTFEVQEKVEMPDSPAGIMYRELIERANSEKDHARKKSLRSLLSLIVENQASSWQGEEILVGSVGVRQNVYEPVDDQTVRRRMIKSGVIPSNVDSGNSEVEIYRDVTTVSYQYNDERKVGVVIVNGIPFPFFSKENISFLEAQNG